VLRFKAVHRAELPSLRSTCGRRDGFSYAPRGAVRMGGGTLLFRLRSRHCTPISSTSNSRSELGGISPGIPVLPHAALALIRTVAISPRDSCATPASQPGTTCSHRSLNFSGRLRLYVLSKILPSAQAAQVRAGLPRWPRGNRRVVPPPADARCAQSTRQHTWQLAYVVHRHRLPGFREQPPIPGTNGFDLDAGTGHVKAYMSDRDMSLGRNAHSPVRPYR